MAAAIAAEREIGDGDWSDVGGMAVRMCVHVGDVVLRDGEPFGWALNFGSRLNSIGHGGQTLLSTAAVEALQTPPADLLAWFGPAISQPAFEVGPEVREAFVAVSPDAVAAFAPNTRGRWQADLCGLARRRLASLGVARVSGGDFCTFSDKARFFSYRREPDCGRMVSLIAIGDLEI